MLPALGKTLSWTVRLGCMVHVAHSGLYEVTETYGESMLPTLSYSGDFVHVNKLCRRGRGCEFGDIIVAAKPTNPLQRVCKRITGLPGDYVLVDPTDRLSPAMIQVPKGHVWVTGDNLAQSIDSRTYGPVPLGLIKGKVVGVSQGLRYKGIQQISGTGSVANEDLQTHGFTGQEIEPLSNRNNST